MRHQKVISKAQLLPPPSSKSSRMESQGKAFVSPSQPIPFLITRYTIFEFGLITGEIRITGCWMTYFESLDLKW